jgi:membrane fusion protein (multidrug efflux system)
MIMNDSAKPSIKKRMVMMLIVVAVVFFGFVSFNAFKAKMIGNSLKGMSKVSQTVSVMVAKKASWQLSHEILGNIRPIKGVVLTVEQPGIIKSILVKPGQNIRQGDVILELVDDVEKAQVEVLSASVNLSKATLERDKPQLAAQAISQAQWDADTADYQVKLAQLNQQKALLAKKIIVAPFSGRVGLMVLSPGQYLNPGDLVTTLQQLDPLLVDFYVTQQQISLVRLGGLVSVTTDILPGIKQQGTITTINSAIDPTTRQLLVEATLVHPSAGIVPGAYAKVRWDYGDIQEWITVSQAAITYNPYGATAFLIHFNGNEHSQGIARQVLVKTGETRGDQVAIISGVQEGEEIVTSGQLKLKNGSSVVINNQLQPEDNPYPTPQE